MLQMLQVSLYAGVQDVGGANSDQEVHVFAAPEGVHVCNLLRKPSVCLSNTLPLLSTLRSPSDNIMFGIIKQ